MSDGFLSFPIWYIYLTKGKMWYVWSYKKLFFSLKTSPLLPLALTS